MQPFTPEQVEMIIQRRLSQIPEAAPLGEEADKRNEIREEVNRDLQEFYELGTEVFMQDPSLPSPQPAPNLVEENASSSRLKELNQKLFGSDP